jgi:preprotein translocase subunit SecB
MQKAAFSIVNYQFDKVSIDLSNHSNKDLSLSFDTSGIFFNETQNFELRFVVKVTQNTELNQNTEVKQFAEVSCKGTFKFENIESFENIPEFFYRNSIAILFPYVRAYLSLVTTQANVPGIILPTLNLSNLETELKKNTTQI